LSDEQPESTPRRGNQPYYREARDEERLEAGPDLDLPPHAPGLEAMVNGLEDRRRRNDPAVPPIQPAPMENINPRFDGLMDRF
jgi:hypothetical protein